MPMMIPNTSDTSVTFSLAELAKIEEERVRHEDAQRARARDKDARERREAARVAAETEAARVAAEAEVRARRTREQAEEKLRVDARERAAIEVARIEAEARARLEADNAVRAHEIAVLRTRREGGRRRLQHVLSAALALALCGGGAVAYAGTRRVATLEQDAEQLREGQHALAREREQARTTELAALDRRQAALRARLGGHDAEEARANVEAARRAIDVRTVDHDRLRAFDDALDALQIRLDALERMTALDRRQADLVAWAAERRRSEVTAAARTAAARAKATGADEAALRAYEGALDQLREALAQPVGRTGPGPVAVAGNSGPAQGPCLDGDPLCGLGGPARPR